MNKEKLVACVEDYLKEHNNDAFLVDLKVSPKNEIQVFMDAMEGFGIESCISLTKFIENKFDRDEEDYELQVSSYSVSEPLLLVQQYVKNIGRDLEVLLKDNTKVTGTLLGVEGDVIELQREEMVVVEGKKKKQKQIINEKLNITQDINRCKIVISFK